MSKLLPLISRGTSSSPFGRLLLAPALLMLAAGCDDPKTGLVATGTSQVALSVSPQVLTLDDGATGAFTTSLEGSDGRSYSANELDWSSDQPGIASVLPGGVIEAKHPGEATIRVRSSQFNLEERVLVMVRPVADDVVFLVRDEVHLGLVGEPLSDSVEVRVIDRGGLPVPNVVVGFGVELGGGTVSPASVATDQNGYAKVEWTLGAAVGSNALDVVETGAAAVAGAAGAKKRRIKIHAWGNAGQPYRIEVDPPSDTIGVSDSNRLTALVLDKYGNEVQGAVVDWTSENSSVASVDPVGTVRGLKEGDATITAKVYTASTVQGAGAPPSKTVSSSASVRVQSPPGTSLVRISGAGQTGSVGSALAEPLVVRAVDAEGTPQSGLSISWSVSGGGGSVSSGSTTTDGSGNASVSWTLGTRPGAQELTAWAPGVQNTVVFSATAVVGSANAVVVTPSDVSLQAGDNQQFQAEVYDSHGNKITDRPVTWETSAPFVVQVDVGGFATAIGGGTAAISASLDGVSGVAHVDVQGGGDGDGGGSGGGGGGSPLTVALSPPTATARALGAVVQLTATVTDETGTLVPQAPVEWTSLNSQVATVDNFGRVVTKAVGTVLVVASTSSASDTATIESTQVVSQVSLEPSSLNLDPGDSALATAAAFDSLGSLVPGVSFEFTTTDSDVVALSVSDRDDQRTIVGTSAGTATVVARADGNTDILSVTVTGPPTVSISTVATSDDSVTIDVHWAPGSGQHRVDVRQDSLGAGGVDNGFGSSSSRVTLFNGLVNGSTHRMSVPRMSGTSWVGAGVRSEPESGSEGGWGYATAMEIPGLSSSSPPPPPPPPPGGSGFRAFPGAEGHGAMALTACGRSNTEVLRVTNLNDSGSGSLRSAIEGARSDRLSLVVFEVGGLVTLSSRIEVRASCLYVAGQTAPGSGITVRAPDKTAFFLKGTGVHDIAFRYLRVRNGTNSPGSNTGGQGMIVGAGSDVIVDHMSFSWAGDQLFMVYNYTNGWTVPRRITLQNTLLHDPFSSSPVCYSTKGDVSAAGDGVPYWYRVSDITFHHNAAINCSHRAPMISSRDAQVINNVVYNWNQGAMHTEGRKPWVDYVGNYFREGPMNRSSATFGYEFSHKFAFNRPGGWNGQEPDNYVLIGNDRKTWDGRAGPSLYLSGNQGPHTGADQWAMTSKYKNDNDTYPESNYASVGYHSVGLMPIEVAGVSLRRNGPLPQADVPVSLESAQAAWNRLIQNGDVGANRRVACDGSWVANQDSVDQRALDQARTGGGPGSGGYVTDENAAGGYPSMSSGSACADADNDGMPDAFEDRYGFDKHSASDALLDADADSYTNLEEYVNGSNPR